MKITLEALRVIDSIDRNQGVPLAAKELNKVPSALYYIVKKLESDLQVELFDRSDYRSKLTEAGNLLLQRGRHLLGEARELEYELKTGTLPEPQVIRLAFDELLPFEWLEPAISEFLNEYPTTSLKLSSEVLNGTWDALVEGRADVIIAASNKPNLNVSLNYSELASIPYVFAVAPSHPLAHYPRPLPTPLIQHYRLAYVSDTSQQLAKASSGYLSTHAYISVPTIMAKLQLQCSGLAIGFLPKYLAQPFIQSGKLVEKEVSQPKVPSRLMVVSLANGVGKKVTLLKELIHKLNLEKRF